MVFYFRVGAVICSECCDRLDWEKQRRLYKLLKGDVLEFSELSLCEIGAIYLYVPEALPDVKEDDRP